MTNPHASRPNPTDAALQEHVTLLEWCCDHEDPRGPALAQDIIREARRQHAWNLEVRALLALAWMVLEQDPPRAQRSTERARELLALHGDVSLTAHLNCLLARLSVTQGEPVIVLRYAQAALAAAESAGHVQHQLHAHSLIGVAHLLVGDHSRALAHQEEVLKQLDQITSPSLTVCLLCDIGANFNDFGAPQDARGFLERALQLSRQHDLRFSNILVSENLGRTLLQLGEYATGESIVQQALDHAMHEGYARWEAYLRCTLGEHHIKRGQQHAGFAQLQRAADAARSVEDHFLFATVHSTLARALRGLGRLKEARLSLQEALTRALKYELLGPAKLAHQELSELLAAEGEYREALAHYQQFHRLAMKVQLEEAQRQAQLQVLQRELDIERQNARQQRDLHAELQVAHEQVQQQARELQRIANEDALTGLANRRHFMARLQALFETLQPFSLLLLDVDHFKNVNDQFGHPIGDQVLRVVSALLRKQVRPDDVVGRVGGEEFGILLHADHEDSTRAIAERIRKVIAEHDWRSLAAGLTVTVSVGVAHRHAAASDEHLISLADQRLYHSKQSGRNRVS